MIVNYFDCLRLFIRPAKADPVLLIDSNTVLAFTISRKRLQAISRRNTEIIQGLGAVQLIKLPAGNLP